jgi:hypothetical protein
MMCSKPNDISCLFPEIDGYNKSEIIALDIEDYPVLSNQARCSIDGFEGVKILKIVFRKLMVPGQ